MNIASIARAAAVAFVFAAHAASAQQLASTVCVAAANGVQGAVGNDSACAVAGTVQDAQLDVAAARSSASASMSAGQMRVTADSEALVTPTGTLQAGGFAEAFLADTLTASGTLSGPVTIVLGMHVDGGFFPSFSARSENTYVLAALRDDTPDSNVHFSGAGLTIRLSDVDNTAYVRDEERITDARSSVQVGALDAIDAISFDLQESFVVSAADPSFSFRAALEAWAETNTTSPEASLSANFGHTAQLYVMAPEGITLSSASGVFLTAPPVSPVPEPGTWVQMLAGLGLLARLARRVGAAR
jgi:PEP-CTERM motif